MTNLGLGARAVPCARLCPPCQDCELQEGRGVWHYHFGQTAGAQASQSPLRLKNTGKMSLWEEPSGLSSYVLTVVVMVSLQQPQWPQEAGRCWGVAHQETVHHTIHASPLAAPAAIATAAVLLFAF